MMHGLTNFKFLKLINQYARYEHKDNQFRKYSFDGILRRDTLWVGREVPTFLNNQIPPSSGKMSDLLFVFFSS